MGERMSVRAAEWHETGAIIRIIEDCGLRYDTIDYERGLRMKIEHDHGSVLVCEHKGRIVGSMLFIYDPWTSFVFQLAVAPQWRGKGIATRLLDHAENIIRHRGSESIAAYILPGNAVSLDIAQRRGYLVYPQQVVCLDKPLHVQGAGFGTPVRG